MAGIGTGIKGRLKKVLSERALNKYKVEVVDRIICISFDMATGTVKSAKIKGVQYAVRNGVVRIPYKRSVLTLLLTEPIKVILTVYGVTFRTELPVSRMKYLGERFVYDKKKYGLADDRLIQITGMLSTDEGFELSYTPVGDTSETVEFVLTDSEKSVSFRSGAVSGGSAVIGISEKDREVWGKGLRLAALDDRKVIPLVVSIGIQKSDDYSLKQNGCFIDVIKANTESYVFMQTNERMVVPPLFDNDEDPRFTTDPVENDVRFLSASKEIGQDISFYWKSLLTGEEVKAASFSRGQKVAFGLKQFIESERAPLDLAVLIYYDADHAEGDSHYVHMALPHSRMLEDHIIIKNDRCQIAYTNEDVLVLESRDCYLDYDKKYEYDLESVSYKTDVSNVVASENRISFDLKVTSLLSPIAQLDFIIFDTYKKRSVKLGSLVLDKGSQFVEDNVDLDLSVLEKDIYEDMYLTFILGVVYSDGYKEEGYIKAAPGRYTARERYMTVSPEVNGTVLAAFLDEDSFNLRLWYTSPDSYSNGVMYHTGRETYYRTIKEEQDDHMIIFESNLGKNYAGNPKYIYEYMISHKEYSGFKYIWTYPDKETKIIPGDPTIVQRGTPDYFYYLAKAKYRINNVRFPIDKKRAGAVYLNTWHGTPLKKLGFDIEREGPEKHAFASLYVESLNWDYLTVDNDYGEEKLVEAFHYKGSVIKKGNPVNDIYFDKDRREKAFNRLVSRFPALKNRRIILYAPTKRDPQAGRIRESNSGLPFSVEKMYERFRDDYVIVLKLYDPAAARIKIDEKYSDFIINASDEEDVMEILCKADILITDYSSIFYDFANAHRPILFYMYDLDEYLNEDRGTYVSVDSLPGPIIKDEADLVEQIRKVKDGEFEYGDRLEAFCTEFSKYCKGTSSRDVVETVIDKEDLL